MAASTSSSLALLLVVMIYAAGGAYAVSYTVGGDNGRWDFPSTPNAYTDWASRQRFVVGDNLVFNFQTGIHNVLEVSSSAYGACTIQNPIAPPHTNGPATVNLTRSGTHYFICGIGTHCSQFNQKMTLSVSAAAAPAPSPPPTTGRPATPPAAATPPPTSSPGPSSPGTPPTAGEPTTPPAAATPPPTSPPPPSSGDNPPSGDAPSNGVGKAAMAAVVLTSVLAALVL